MYEASPTPMPPDTMTAPVLVDSLTVLDSTVRAPVSVLVPAMLRALPPYTSPATPRPPLATMLPVVVEELSVLSVTVRIPWDVTSVKEMRPSLTIPPLVTMLPSTVPSPVSYDALVELSTNTSPPILTPPVV